VDSHSALKANARGIVKSHARFGLGKILVTVQVALSLSFWSRRLMVKTFAKLATLDTGFDKNQVFAHTCRPSLRECSTEPPPAALPGIAETSRAIPGVRSASFADITPVSGSSSNQIVHVEGYVPKSRKRYGRVDQFDQPRILRHHGDAIPRRPRFQRA
jgi:hypothetical protein